jgi:hypothetical protein
VKKLLSAFLSNLFSPLAGLLSQKQGSICGNCLEIQLLFPARPRKFDPSFLLIIWFARADAVAVFRGGGQSRVDVFR